MNITTFHNKQNRTTKGLNARPNKTQKRKQGEERIYQKSRKNPPLDNPKQNPIPPFFFSFSSPERGRNQKEKRKLKVGGVQQKRLATHL